MKLWLDAQLSPKLVPWLVATFELDALAAQSDAELRTASDAAIFQAARSSDAVVMTKDRDFVDLVDRLGPPPRVIWLTFGNTSNRSMRQILTSALPTALRAIEGGEPIVEISDRTTDS